MRAEQEDRPEPVWSCWNYWIAVPTGDQAGVMETLGLTASRPMTFAQAREMIDTAVHGGLDHQVYVSPEVDGWTLVIGPWCDPCDEDVLSLCLALSARYARCQAYYFGEQGDGSAWLVAEHGNLVRRYAATDDDLPALGLPLPQEQARLLSLGLPADLATASAEELDEWAVEAAYLAPEIATSYGVTPHTLTKDTVVRGTGKLALTPVATAHQN
ncbi:hypothetical protein ACFWYW_31915 [Nonomuraea sp. NPDC059023]|uniref:hypothetical protein n=1 Tax=unclassified Nonomuraea TaxID=2593643 RepID=UPI0036B699D1